MVLHFCSFLFTEKKIAGRHLKKLLTFSDEGLQRYGLALGDLLDIVDVLQSQKENPKQNHNVNLISIPSSTGNDLNNECPGSSEFMRRLPPRRPLRTPQPERTESSVGSKSPERTESSVGSKSPVVTSQEAPKLPTEQPTKISDPAIGTDLMSSPIHPKPSTSTSTSNLNSPVFKNNYSGDILSVKSLKVSPNLNEIDQHPDSESFSPDSGSSSEVDSDDDIFDGFALQSQVKQMSMLERKSAKSKIRNYFNMIKEGLTPKRPYLHLPGEDGLQKSRVNSKGAATKTERKTPSRKKEIDDSSDGSEDGDLERKKKSRKGKRKKANDDGSGDSEDSDLEIKKPRISKRKKENDDGSGDSEDSDIERKKKSERKRKRKDGDDSSEESSSSERDKKRKLKDTDESYEENSDDGEESDSSQKDKKRAKKKSNDNSDAYKERHKKRKKKKKKTKEKFKDSGKQKKKANKKNSVFKVSIPEDLRVFLEDDDLEDSQKTIIKDYLQTPLNRKFPVREILLNEGKEREESDDDENPPSSTPAVEKLLESGVVFDDDLRKVISLLLKYLYKQVTDPSLITVELRENLAVCFVAAFPKMAQGVVREKDLPWTWLFDRRNNSGKLAHHHANKQRQKGAVRLRGGGTEKKKGAKKTLKPLPPPQYLNIDDVPRSKDAKHLSLIVPDDSERAQIERLMNVTYDERRGLIGNANCPNTLILQAYPHLKSFEGRMIDLEFEKMFGSEKNHLFLRNFQDYVPRLLQVGKENPKKYPPEKFFIFGDSVLNSLLILSKFVPRPKRCYAWEEDNETLPMVEDFVEIVPEGSTLQQKIDLKRKNSKSAVQPYILATGAAKKIESFAVVLGDSHVIKLPKDCFPLRAVDVLIKAQYALGTHFCLGWKNVYRFLSAHIYKIPPENDKLSIFTAEHKKLLAIKLKE